MQKFENKGWLWSPLKSILRSGHHLAHGVPKLLHIEGLGDYPVHCERVISRQAQSLGVACNHDYQLLRGFGLDQGGERVAFAPRHLVIKNNKVELAPLSGGQSVVAVGSYFHLMLIQLQNSSNRFTDQRIVIDDQDPARRVFRCCHSIPSVSLRVVPFNSFLESFQWFACAARAVAYWLNTR